MTLPAKYRNLRMQVKYNLMCYRACLDCRYAIERLKESDVSYSAWKVQWAGICALLKSSIHLMGKRDAKSCLPESLKVELKAAYEELGINKTLYPLFWNFIDRERHNILKEYEFSAYEAIISADGVVRPGFKGILNVMSEGEKEAILIKSGDYKGRHALEVLTEAAAWVEKYIFDAIIKAGYDPEERRYAATLLPIEKLSEDITNTILG